MDKKCAKQEVSLPIATPTESVTVDSSEDVLGRDKRS